MPLNAGELRHRITVDEPQYAQDLQTGERTRSWAVFAADIAAKISPLSATEYVAGQAQQSKVVARITIRHLPGLRADMRIRHLDTVYNIEGILPDPDSGLEWMTIVTSAGVNQG